MKTELKIINIQEAAGGTAHRVHVHIVDRRVLAQQLRSGYKMVATVNEIERAKFVIIENIDTSVCVVTQNGENAYNIHIERDVDLYYAYYDLAVELSEKTLLISADNFQNICKDQIEYAAPGDSVAGSRKVEIRRGVPDRNIKSVLLNSMLSDIEEKDSMGFRPSVAEIQIGKKDGSKELERETEFDSKQIMKQIKACSRAECKINREEVSELLPEEFNGTIIKAIIEIYKKKIISLVFWDKGAVFGIMLQDYRILPLNVTSEQYGKLSKIYGHVIER